MKKLGILLLTGLTGCVAISTHEKLKRDYSKLQSQITETQGQLTEQQKTNEALKLSEAELKTKIDEIRSTYDELIENLKEDIKQGDIGVENTDGKLTITMGNQVLFQSGRATLQPRGQKILLSVSQSLRKIKDNYIEVEGHTDNIPIRGSLKNKYATNWELSATRATAVVRYLQEQGGVEPSLMYVSAFSEFRPLADNSTPEGREQNRRVEISLVPQKK